MPRDYNKDAYPEPPKQTAVSDRQTALPDLTEILTKVFIYTVDVPVSAFRGFVEYLRVKERPVYYHQQYRRVPYLTECEEGDYVCYYEAEMQWRRDFKVDQEIIKIVRERFQACLTREGQSAKQNCDNEKRLLYETSGNYRSRYGDLGAYAGARQCLMKQKERMMEAQAQKA
ncbi:NADH dehydrogenase [ubiquinone] 1 beta subcomplex subunit 10 [Halichoeres trimaculatus]|uniref:NADH dehydrogenase [ubiquinone] 1 beta subcomplex subunit 10 n=1 Tax=Halichoeres trimaculatus TaxID=147232 RepID=UPI003D9EFEBF